MTEPCSSYSAYEAGDYVDDDGRAWDAERLPEEVRDRREDGQWIEVDC